MKHGCCIEESCTAADCMALPYGVRCEHCAHIERCRKMFGRTGAEDHCDWFPRKFVPAQYGRTEVPR